MRHYRITPDLRSRVNDFLGTEYLKPSDLGREYYHLENYEAIKKVSREKAKLLMATLFPEAFHDEGFLRVHKREVINLSRRLHVKRSRRFSWTHFMVRREGLPDWSEDLQDEDIMKGNIVRFR